MRSVSAPLWPHPRPLSVVIRACLAGTLCASAHAQDVPTQPLVEWQQPDAAPTAPALDAQDAVADGTPADGTPVADMPWSEVPSSMRGIVPPEPEEVAFDDAFLGMAPGGSSIDISRFNKGNPVTPGAYLLDVVTNGIAQGRQSLQFEDVQGKKSAQLCLDRTVVGLLGVDLDSVDRARRERPADWEGLDEIPDQPRCGDLADYVQGATAAVDLASQRLVVSVPQLYAKRTRDGAIDRRLWDPGINAGILSYRVNSHQRRSPEGDTSHDLYADFDGGINAGAWQLRHRGNQTWRDGGRNAYAGIQTVLRRDVPALGARLSMGEFGSPSDLFDSVPLRGVSLATDDRMLPGDASNYVPRIRGMAVSNAKVSVYQRGQLIHETSVSPGPFELDDINPASRGGDLLVEVTEASGNITRFIVPYSTTARMLPKGVSRWSISAGQLQSSRLADAPLVIQAAWQHGLSDRFTGYAGVVGLSGYRAAQAGLAVNTRVGGFSVDVTHARTALPGHRARAGSNWRARYSKALADYGTTLNVSGYRYATSGYAGLQDAVLLQEQIQSGKDPSQRARPRQRIDLSINQTLPGRWGQFYLSAAAQRYDDARTSAREWSAGYSNTLGPATISLSAQRTWITDAQQGRTFADNRLYAMASMPLGRTARSGRNRGQVSLAVNHAEQSGTSHDLTYTGNSTQDDRWSYAATVSRNAQGRVNHAASGTYTSDAVRMSARYSGGNATAVSASVGGTAVVHAGGVNFTSRTGETFAIIHAPGAEGAGLRGRDRTVRLNRNGYGVTSAMTPYRLNTLELDAEGTSTDVEIKNTVSTVAPYDGAVVRLEYATEIGRLLTLHATGTDGQPLPFGADVLDADGTSVGVIAQAGTLVARGVEDGQWLQVRWGNGEAGQCALRVPVSTRDDAVVACGVANAMPPDTVHASRSAAGTKRF